MARLFAQTVAMALVGASLAGCSSNNGTEPPTDQFFFPISAVLHRPAPDREADWLYVVNSDFDLAYNGSTVVAVDLARVRERMRDHVGCVEDPNARGAYVCPEGPLIRASSTRKLNAYATEATLATYRGGSIKRLYVIVRGGNTLAWFDVNSDGSLDCGPADANGYCAASHLAGGDPAQSPNGARLPIDPSAMSVDTERGWIVLTHQSVDDNGFRASLFRDPIVQSSSTAQRSAPTLLGAITGTARGLSSLVLLPRTRADERSTWLATSRAEPTFTLLQVYPGATSIDDRRAFLYRASQAPVTGLNSGADSRAIALDVAPGTRRAFVVSRRPEALLTVDLSNPNTPTVSDAIALPQGASRLVAVYNAALGHSLVYTVSYDSRWIYVVDPDNHRVIGQLLAGRGPHTLTHDERAGMLYVVNFLDASVEIIDTRVTTESGEANPFYNRRVLTFGRPGRVR